MRRRSWWGWGYEGEGLTDDEVAVLGAALAERFGLDGTRRAAPDVDDLEMAPPRLTAPPALASLASAHPQDRAAHAYGKSYCDVVRCLDGDIAHPPDMVMRPRRESDVVNVLDWCSSQGVAAIPYGGGSSVVGGVEPDVGEGYRGAISVDLGALDAVLEVDGVSLAARIQGGILGPDLERQLKAYGLTLRHFPQSFECSTLGGWIATRAGGHFATGPTHIDDLVEGMRVVTPTGTVETRRLPASGAGPSPDRLFLGSEGILGIVTEAWMRVRPRPRWRSGGAVRFATLFEGASAVRALAQSGLQPSNCRLLDPMEALLNGAGDGRAAVLIVGFESADHPMDASAARAAELVADHGGELDAVTWQHVTRRAPGGPGGGDGDDASDRSGDGGDVGAARAWRSAFMRAPYVRDALVTLGVLCDTFETAVTWDRFEHLHASVSNAVRAAFDEIGAPSGFLTCRFTHAYPDGVAPYYTVIAPARRGAELDQWAVVKAAASEAVLAAGGTITHHHAVGRVHRAWYDRQRPEAYARALRAAKAALDPAGVCNPGVLVDRWH